MFFAVQISQFTCAHGGVLLFDGLSGDLLRVQAQHVLSLFLFIFYFSAHRYTFRTCGAGHQSRLWAFNLAEMGALGRGGYHAGVTANFLFSECGSVWEQHRFYFASPPENHQGGVEGGHFEPIFAVKSTISFQAQSFYAFFWAAETLNESGAMFIPQHD